MPSREAGFSLIEALVAAVIAIIAAVGLAHSFGLGRSFINRFEVARAALAAAQQRLEILETRPRTSDEFSRDSLHMRPFVHGERQIGEETWRVTWWDDPATTPSTHDMLRVDVVVRWTQTSLPDSVPLTRLFMSY